MTEAQGRPDQSDPGKVARDLLQSLQDVIERMNRLGQAGVAGMPHVIGQWVSALEAGAKLTTLPLRQMQALVDLVRTQREQVRALQGQLKVFEDQLTALEKSLQPLVTWGEQWTRMQESVLNQVRSQVRGITKTES
jgi:hypothetical protein